MSIPLPTRLLWAVLSRLGKPMLQLPPDQLRAASEKRRRLGRLPGARLVVGRAHPDVRISEQVIAGPDGAELPLRVYRPVQTGATPLPIVLNFHGGGFVAGDPEQSEWWCSSIAHDVPAVVVSVDYRLAPEHLYPAAPEDCYAATVWAAEHGADVGGDGSRLAVMGDSAGGNLAAVIALMSRDRGGPTLALQLLLYPAVDLVGTYPSEDENEFAPILGKADLRIHEVYCPGREAEQYASPLLADSHADLAPAFIQTAEHDPLRDQGPVYAAALRADGVAVRHTNFVDGVHGYVSIPGVQPCARQALGEAVAELRDAFVTRVPNARN